LAAAQLLPSRGKQAIPGLTLSEKLLARIIASTQEPARLELRLPTRLDTLELLRRAPRRGPGYALVLEVPDRPARLLALLDSTGRILYAEAVDAETGDRLEGPAALAITERLEGDAVAAVAPLRERIVEWSPRLSVHVKGIDLQHRQLIAALNQLWQSILTGAARARLRATIDFLEDYSRFHFRTEERFFTRHGYPKSEEHKQQHNWFIEKIREEKDTVSAAQEDMHAALDVVAFLADWVENHIAKADRDYGEWLKKKGVIPRPPA